MFQSTRPARGATCTSASGYAARARFQSTRPARGATVHDVTDRCRSASMFQSTRPARGATRHRGVSRRIAIDVSIHAPRAGRDVDTAVLDGVICTCFNPRAPRGARPRRRTRSTAAADVHVSIHAPRAGRDASDCGAYAAASMFQSTRPARGATVSAAIALRSMRCFNPRAPRGARRQRSRDCSHGS